MLLLIFCLERRFVVTLSNLTWSAAHSLLERICTILGLEIKRERFRCKWLLIISFLTMCALHHLLRVSWWMCTSILRHLYYWVPRCSWIASLRDLSWCRAQFLLRLLRFKTILKVLCTQLELSNLHFLLFDHLLKGSVLLHHTLYSLITLSKLPHKLFISLD